MEKNKINVSVICGGPGRENKVSLISGAAIGRSLDKELFNVSTIIMDTESNFFFHKGIPDEVLENSQDVEKVELKSSVNQVYFCKNGLRDLGNQNFYPIDMIFNIVHGTLGEDGCLQGLFKVFGIPSIGSGLPGSVNCMDKLISKKLMRDSKLPVIPCISFAKSEIPPLDSIISELGLPLFVKPLNTGSSVGISKVSEKKTLTKALDRAFEVDDKVLVEAAKEVREIEFAVFMDHNSDELRVSVPGEIIVDENAEFYSYEVKYINTDSASLRLPAELSPEQLKKMSALAKKAFLEMNCLDYARVDFFLCGEEFFINEINTLPGFTPISMFPNLWLHEGISYEELLTLLVANALKRQKRQVYQQIFK